MKYVRLPLFLLVFALAAVGCDGDSGGDNDPTGLTLGSSSIEITGASSVSVDGTGTANSTNLSPGWGIIMGAAGSGATGFVIASDTGDRPGKGSYPISNSSSSDLPEGTYRATLSVDSEVYVGASGNLNITESSSTEVKGTFSFSATGIIDVTNTLNVSGSFFSRNTISTGGSNQ